MVARMTLSEQLAVETGARRTHTLAHMPHLGQRRPPKPRGCSSNEYRLDPGTDMFPASLALTREAWTTPPREGRGKGNAKHERNGA